ncbi:MAG: serine--tRNA ligase [Deltaproteobacteria bacterium]|jgi:seryl-tRNA synthetase|nr:serine--tRNA ligase [Deltaproteobacteria bacterium]
MLDLKFIRDNQDAVQANCNNRNVHVSLDNFVHLDEQRRENIGIIEAIRQKQNENAKRMKGKLSDEDRKKFIEIGKELKSEEGLANDKLKAMSEELDNLVRQIPNMTHPESPIAATEDGNREIRQWGDVPQFDFKPLDHVQLGEKLDLLDFESGAKVAGQKFYYLKNEAVLLEQALINYSLNLLMKEGFTPVMTPDLARESILDGIGFNPRGEETQIYSIENSDLCLIATAEITLGGMLMDSILDEKDLPKKFVGISHCFRTEAGAAGKESKGLYRVHQFSKVEMFAFTTPEQSSEMHDEIAGHEEKIFQGLGIPYRVVDICTGDLGGPAYRKFDLEAWMPGRGDGGEWGEVTSTSNCTDYQSRRLKVRYRKEGEKKPQFVHMLNGTAVAVSRAMISILENYQQKDGSVLVPEALQPYMGGIEKIFR